MASAGLRTPLCCTVLLCNAAIQLAVQLFLCYTTALLCYYCTVHTYIVPTLCGFLTAAVVSALLCVDSASHNHFRHWPTPQGDQRQKSLGRNLPHNFAACAFPLCQSHSVRRNCTLTPPSKTDVDFQQGTVGGRVEAEFFVFAKNLCFTCA